MPLVSRKIPHFLSGISQLPPSRRGLTQAEAQLNMLSSVKKGLTKRPPTDWIAQLVTSGTGYDTAFTHRINRSDTERWRAIFIDDDLKVFDEDGAEATVNFPNGKGYLNAADPKTALRAVSVGDTVYVVNKNITTAKGTALSAGIRYEALLVVREGDFETKYVTTLDGLSVLYTTPTGESPTDRQFIDTSNIATEIKVAIEAATANFTITQYGPVLHIKRANGADFTIESADGLSGGMVAIKDKVQRFDLLPEVAVDGFTVEVLGDDTTEFDNYWLVYRDSDSALRGGVWQETVQPGELTEFDGSTMPHVLVRGGTAYEDLTVDEDLLALPTCTLAADPAGASKEGFASTLNGTENTALPLLDEGDVAYANLDNADGVSTTYRVYYDILSTPLAGGDQARVEVWVNDGVASTNWTLKGQKDYTQSLLLRYNEFIEFTATLSQDWDVRLRLTYPAKEGEFSFVHVWAHQSGDALAGVEYTPAGTQVGTVDIGASSTLGRLRPQYPDGTLVRVTINGGNNDYTTVGDTDADTIVSNLITTINTNHSGQFLAARTGRLGEFQITEVAGSFTTLTCSDNMPVSTALLSFNLDVETDELVGLTVTNNTDGSSGVITGNSTASIEVSAGLSGGTNNAFRTGDDLTVSASATNFIFKRAEWSAREVGDLTTNPFPSFVGKALTDVFFFRNRLGLIMEGNIILTRNGDLGNFFRETATTLLDTDPIDVKGGGPSVSDFHSAVQWNKRLLLWTELQQYELLGEPILSPSTARVDMVSQYENTKLVRPFVAGSTVFYAQQNNNVTEVFEYQQSSEREETLDGTRITADVPGYILGTPLQLTGSPAHGLLVLRTSNAAATVYVYKYAHDLDGRKVQGGWSKWTFEPTTNEVISIDFLDDTMGLVIKKDDGVHLLTSYIHEGNVDADRACLTHMDYRIKDTNAGVGSSYAAGPDETTFTLPYSVEQNLPTIAQDTFTDTDNTGLTSHTADSGFGAWADLGVGIGNLPTIQDTVESQCSMGDFWLKTNNINTKVYRSPSDISYDLTNGFDVIVRAGRSTNTFALDHLDLMLFMGNGASDQESLVLSLQKNAGGTIGVFILRVNASRAIQQTQVIDDAFAFAASTGKTLKFEVRPNGANWEVQAFYKNLDGTGTYTQIIGDGTGDIGGTGTAVMTGVVTGASNSRFGIAGAGNSSGSWWETGEVSIVNASGGTPDGNHIVVKRDGTGDEIAVVRSTNSAVVVSGDHTSTAVYIGVEATFSYQLSTIYLRDREGASITSGRLNLRNIEFEYTDTRDLTITIDPQRTGINARVYTVANTGSCGASGFQRVPIMTKNTQALITLSDTGPQPWNLQAANWEGVYHNRSRRT